MATRRLVTFIVTTLLVLLDFASAAINTSSNVEQSCACLLDPKTSQLSCSRLTDFKELCASPLGRSAGDHPTLDEVTTVSVVDSTFGNFSFDFLSNFRHVQNVTLRNNSFLNSTIRPSLGVSPELQVLDLSANHLLDLAPGVFGSFPALKILDLSHNDINKLDQSCFARNRHLREIHMHDNPLRCEEMEWFLKWVKATPEVTLHERQNIKCTYYEKGTGFGSVTFESLLDHCPKNCTCHKVRASISIYCQNKGYRSFPTLLPETSSMLHMEDNQIESLNSLINGSNYITVRFLYVNNNSIDSINTLERTDFFKELNVLHISGNRLTQLPTHMIDRMMTSSLIEMKLGNNPWNCECIVVAPFHDLLVKHFIKFTDIDQIRCASDGSYHPNQPIYKLSKQDFCAKLDYINPLDIVNGTFILAIFFIVAKVLYDYRRLKRTGKLPMLPFQQFFSRKG